MTRWTRKLIGETVAAFNAGETQKSIATRLRTSVKAISIQLCRVRQGYPGSLPVHVERRTGFKSRKDSRLNENI